MRKDCLTINFNYFTLLYGLNIIETDAKEKNIDSTTVNKIKKEFLKKVQEYYDMNKKHYLKEELEQLLKINVSEKFKEILEENAWEYFDNPELSDMIRISKGLVNNYDEVTISNPVLLKRKIINKKN